MLFGTVLVFTRMTEHMVNRELSFMLFLEIVQLVLQEDIGFRHIRIDDGYLGIVDCRPRSQEFVQSTGTRALVLTRLGPMHPTETHFLALDDA